METIKQTHYTIPSRHLPHPRVHPQRHVRHHGGRRTAPKAHGGELGAQEVAAAVEPAGRADFMGISIGIW